MEKVRNYLNLLVENEPVCNCRLNYNILPIDHYYEYIALIMIGILLIINLQFNILKRTFVSLTIL